MATWKEKYNKKYGYEKDESHSLADISKKTGVSKKGLQQIYNKGVGAWKTNLPSVRLKGSFKKNKNTKKFPRSKRLGKSQWAMARVYSAVMGGKASKVDAKELKMEKGGFLITPISERIDFLKFILDFDSFGRSEYELANIQSELNSLLKQSFRQGGNVGVDNSNQYIKGKLNEKINWSEYYEQGGIMDKEIRSKLFDSKGERKIDPKSIELLTEYVNSLPQTKSMYFDLDGYTPDRKALHSKIINSFKDNLVCIESDEPIAILMGGSPASGKSTFLRKYAPYLLSTELLRIDADEIRAMLPEYEGWNASQTHLETKDIVNTLLSDRTIGLPCNFDLIYDGTMNNTKSYIPLITLLKGLGYKIYVVYIDNVPKDEIIERALGRYQRSGRFVPLEVIEDFFSKGKTALNEIKQKADGYMIIDGSSSDYEIIEEGGIKLPQNREYSILGREIQDYDENDKVEFYKTYYRNLSPDTFKIRRINDDINISNIQNKIMAKGGDVSDKIRLLKSEGYPQEQAVAIALSMRDNNKLRQGGATDVDLETDAILGEFYAKGGETDFNPDGAIKGKVVHASGDAGGMLVGKRHSEGGIKAINKSTGQPLEMEGGEVVITRNAVSDKKKRSFNGKMMTNREILSAINESGGGVSFAEGGELPEQVSFDCEANYEYGGENMCGKDLAFAMGGTVTTAIVTDPNEAMADLQSTYGFGNVYEFGGEISAEVKNKLDELKSERETTLEYKSYLDFLTVYENAKKYNLPLEVGKGKDKILLETQYINRGIVPSIDAEDGLANSFAIKFGKGEKQIFNYTNSYTGMLPKLFAIEGKLEDGANKVIGESNVVSKLIVREYSDDDIVFEANNFLELAEGFSKQTSRRRDFDFYADFSDGTKDVKIANMEGYLRQPTGWKARYYFGFKNVKKRATEFFKMFEYNLGVTGINIIPFLMGLTESSLKKQAEKEENEKRLKKEKADQKLIESFTFTKFPTLKPETELKLKELDSQSKQLASLLPFFKGVNNSFNRIKILKELRKNYLEQEKIKLKPQDGLTFLSPSFLLDYYYTQTTQSPVVKLGKPCKLETPTGKPSKLPIEAYVNVRQNHFKEWFGFWENAYQDNNYSNCSKCINPETAEPELFYHGVRKFKKGLSSGAMGSGISRPFGSFTPFGFPASYFSPNIEYAKFYAGLSKNIPTIYQSDGFIYPVFINMRNPLDLRPLGFKASYKDFRDFIILSVGVKIDYTKNVLKLVNNNINEVNMVWQYIRNDVRIIEILKKAGIDGIIQEGDVPKYDKSGQPLKDRSKWIKEVEYLTFYPNQIKSATVKKSMYSSLFEDIRFKKGGNVSI